MLTIKMKKRNVMKKNIYDLIVIDHKKSIKSSYIEFIGSIINSTDLYYNRYTFLNHSRLNFWLNKGCACDLKILKIINNFKYFYEK